MLLLAALSLASLITIDRTNYTSLSTGTKDTFLMIWAPWCGHCVRAKPAFAEAAQQVSTVDFALLNGDDQPDMAAVFGVRGYPTFMHIKGPVVREYNGGRSAKDFAAFVKDPVAIAGTPPLPWSKSPFTILGQGYAKLAYAGVFIQKVAQYGEEYNVSPYITIVVVTMLMFVVSSVCAVCLLRCCDDTTPAPKKKKE